MVSESDTLPERGQFSEIFGKSTVFSTLNRCKTPLIGLQTSFFVNQHVLQQSKVLCSLVCHPKNSVLGVLKWRRQEFCDFVAQLGTRILTTGTGNYADWAYWSLQHYCGFRGRKSYSGYRFPTSLSEMTSEHFGTFFKYLSALNQ